MPGFCLILNSAGLVVRDVVGDASDMPHDPATETVVAGGDAPAGATVKWTRNPDGTWTNPNAPKAPSAADLVAYLKARRAAIVDTKLIPVTDVDGVARQIPIEIQTRTALTAGRVKVGEDPDYTIKSWTYPTGEVKPIGKIDIIAFGDAVEEAFQHMFDQQAICLAGIAGGSVTTTDQIEQTLGA